VLGSLASLDVSGNPLGNGGAAALLLAQQGADRAVRLLASDVCVRPDTPLDAMLQRAAKGDMIDGSELQSAGIDALAASALVSAAEAVKVAKGKKGKKLKAPPPADKPKPLARRKSTNDELDADWRRTDRKPDLEGAAS